MAWLRQLGIGQRMLIQAAVCLIGLIVIVAENLTGLYKSQYELKIEGNKTLVESAYSIMEMYHAKEQAGELSRAEAQAQAKDIIADLRYEGDNYFWLQDDSPRMIMHPTKPSLNGQDLSQIQDPAGKYLFREMATVARQTGEGMVDYQWPYPGQEEPVDKISYVKNFAPWGWIIGSGTYIMKLQEDFKQAATFPLIASLLVILAIFSIGWVINRSVTLPLKETSSALTNIASGNGDLTRRLTVNPNHRDEVAEVARGFNTFAEKIEGIIIEFRSATLRLNESSRNLRQTVDRNTESLGKQQNESQSMATAVSEMAATANEIAQNAGTAASSTSEMTEEAEGGRQVVDQAVTSVNTLGREFEHTGEVIGSLNRDSQSITSVLEVIRGIAEQTNLLALNAAIEAARAGEQGRGFAVVADEVRTLAARTQTSTEEIRQMIDSLQNGSETAVKVMESSREASTQTVEKVNQAGQSLNSIVTAIGTISDMNLQIASAAEEQSAVASQIEGSINLMADLCSRSFTEMENTAQFTRELDQMSDQLNALVGQFTVRNR